MSLRPPVPALAIVALGANLGDAPTTLRAAMQRLQQFSGEPLRKSSLWQSTPVDCPPGSPLFVNAAVAMTPSAAETSESLLAKLQALEIEFGRRAKRMPDEARPLDLDLVVFGAEVLSTLQLTLPHPRAHQRRFVLEPLNEITPDLILPGQTKTVRQLLAELKTDEVVTRLS